MILKNPWLRDRNHPSQKRQVPDLCQNHSHFYGWRFFKRLCFSLFFWQRRPDLIPRRDLPVYKKTPVMVTTKKNRTFSEPPVPSVKPPGVNRESRAYKEDLDSFKEVFGTLTSRVDMVNSKVKTISYERLLQSGIKSKLDFCTLQMKSLLSILEELCLLTEIDDTPPTEDFHYAAPSVVPQPKKFIMHLNMSQVESMVLKEGGTHKASSAPPSEARKAPGIEGIKKIKEQAEETLHRISKGDEMKSIKIEGSARTIRKSYEGVHREGIKMESARGSRKSGTRLVREDELLKTQSRSVKLKKEEVKFIPKVVKKNPEVTEITSKKT